jgi:hypothetical protein
VFFAAKLFVEVGTGSVYGGSRTVRHLSRAPAPMAAAATR